MTKNEILFILVKDLFTQKPSSLAMDEKINQVLGCLNGDCRAELVFEALYEKGEILISSINHPLVLSSSGVKTKHFCTPEEITFTGLPALEDGLYEFRMIVFRLEKRLSFEYKASDPLEADPERETYFLKQIAGGGFVLHL